MAAVCGGVRRRGRDGGNWPISTQHSWFPVAFAMTPFPSPTPRPRGPVALMPPCLVRVAERPRRQMRLEQQMEKHRFTLQTVTFWTWLDLGFPSGLVCAEGAASRPAAVSSSEPRLLQSPAFFRTASRLWTQRNSPENLIFFKTHRQKKERFKRTEISQLEVMSTYIFIYSIYLYLICMCKCVCIYV